MILVTLPKRFGLPVTPSDSARCERCSAEVWVPHDQAGADAILCVVCAMSVVKVGDRIEEAPWAVILEAPEP